MARQVLCDNFRQEQFVPARQIRTVLSVYVASREERSASNGLGCAVKDLLSGDEKRIKIADLMRMKVLYPNGKPVKAYSLKGGQTYTVVGVPAQQNYGVFIVPPGEAYEYIYKDRPLPPSSCILFDGKTTKVIDYRLFRKMFIMSPNPVSAGQKRGSSRVNTPTNFGQPRQQAPNNIPNNVYDRFKRPQQPQGYPQQPQGYPQQQAYPQKQAYPQQPQAYQKQPNNYGNQQAQSNSGQLNAVGRILRGNDLVGLVLSDGKQQMQVPYQQCVSYARKHMIANVEVANRGGTVFLRGNGISLEYLPTTQV